MNHPTPRVLFIDDREQNIRTFKEIFYSVPYDILTASDGWEGLEIANSKQPDLIVLDIMMPEFDGFEVYKALRAKPKTEEIPVIFLTALTDPEERIRGLELGAIDFISKPIDAKELILRVSNQLDKITFQKKLEQLNADLEKRVAERTSELLEANRKLTIEIQKHKASQKEIKKLSRAVEQSPVSVVITDAEALIEYVNPKFTQITGYEEQEVMGKKTSILSSGITDPETYETLWKTVRSGKEWFGELYNKRKDGNGYWCSVSISPIYSESDEITHFVAIMEDITLRKKNEKEILLAKEEAEEASRLKSILLTNLSHEFRTPMNAILGYTDILKKEIDDENYTELLDGISSTGERLLSTLTSILHLSSIEAGMTRIKIDLCNIYAIAESVFKHYRTVANNKGLSFSLNSTNDMIFAHCDEMMVTEIIRNIVDNAIKYTSTGSVEINIGEEKDLQYVKVKDTGIGIPESDFEKIFLEFRQGSEGLSRMYEGSGLGLAVSKKMADLMGTTIEVESKQGEYSIFTIRFHSHIEGTLSQNKNVETVANTDNKDNTNLTKDLSKISVPSQNMLDEIIMLCKFGDLTELRAKISDLAEMEQYKEFYKILQKKISTFDVDGIHSFIDKIKMNI